MKEEFFSIFIHGVTISYVLKKTEQETVCDLWILIDKLGPPCSLLLQININISRKRNYIINNNEIYIHKSMIKPVVL
jgi:hypothetical protein